MTLQERVAASLADIEAQINYVQKKAETEVTALQIKRATLVGAQKLITPEIEAAVAGLKKIGVLGDL